MSAWHSSAMPLCVTGITNHITDMNTTSNKLGIRLMNTMTLKIPPHHVAVIPVAPSSHSLHSPKMTTELIEVMKNALLHIEQPHL